MSTPCTTSAARKNVSLPGKTREILSVLCAFLFALQLVLFSSSFVFAAVQRPGDTLPSQDITRAGVSVVRLLVTYNNPKASANTLIQCTGLGMLVDGWTATPTAANNPNNWVLTDGNLVNLSNEATCAGPARTGYKLSSITVYFSSAYNSQTLSANADLATVRCQNENTCSNGAALLAFATDSTHTLPYSDVAQTDTTAETGIALVKQQASLTPPPPSIVDAKQVATYKTTIEAYLTPERVPTTGLPGTMELGTPFVNSRGELTGMHLNVTGAFTAQDIKGFLSKQAALKPVPTHMNIVHDTWNSGLNNFYQGPSSYPQAHAAFLMAASANSQFEAAKNFAQLTNVSTGIGGSENTGSGNGQATTPGSFIFFGIPVPSWSILVLIVIGLLLLIVILIITSITFGRARAQRLRAIQQEYAEAQRMAAEMMKQQQQKMLANQPTLVPLADHPANNTAQLSPAPDLICPNCGNPVARDATYCGNCRYLLSPSDSGLHLRVKAPPQSSPTPSAPLPASSLSEQPTMEMSPSLGGDNGQVSDEKTLPYSMRQVRGERLGIVAGTRTDPGIKRKYKPNEDSLFAAQGASNGLSSFQSFGLFVVADGMGGHANGQDASRTAIQTIIDFMLPKLTTVGEVSSEALMQLLTEGVQGANQAVHKHNMEQHADMGTTMTAALVVDSTAYIANVGDSRTYLYRAPGGLSKVTHDHSVVASLVDAGIIKPDDIYTHPKRNQIYRSLGEKPVVEVDSFMVPLQAGDKLLLCSDGLWDMVRDPKIEEVLKNQGPDPLITGDALIKAALEGGGEDNVSVIVVNITEASQHGGMPVGVQLLYKPESVQMPQM